jgi:endonuclease/exonuclease/phosphatase family metal-dependent hydrolase
MPYKVIKLSTVPVQASMKRSMAVIRSATAGKLPRRCWLSNAPIHGWRNILLPRSGNLEQRGLLEALGTVRRVPGRVFTTHLQHNSQQERIAQIVAIRVIGMAQEPVILVGDLNARPGTPEIAAITEDLVDAWTETGVGDGYTYSTQNPHARLDYVLHSNDVMTRTAAVLSTDGSAHLPVTADLPPPGDRMAPALRSAPPTSDPTGSPW